MTIDRTIFDICVVIAGIVSFIVCVRYLLGSVPATSRHSGNVTKPAALKPPLLPSICPRCHVARIAYFCANCGQQIKPKVKDQMGLMPDGRVVSIRDGIARPYMGGFDETADALIKLRKAKKS